MPSSARVLVATERSSRHSWAWRPRSEVRDEYRTDYDGGRGGYGMIMKQKLEIPDFIK